jgi:hypothetical protein
MKRIMMCVTMFASALLLTGAAQTGTPPTGSQQAVSQQKPAESTPAKADLSDVEEHPDKYLGKTLVVTGEVDGVLGPKLFVIDEPNWADPDREVLVYTEAPLAALVDENDRVTVTGTLTPFAEVELQRDWGFSSLGPEVKAKIRARPVLVAKHLVDARGKRVMEIAIDSPTPTGTSGTQDAQAPITSVDTIAKAANTSLVGRRVALQSVKVDRVESNGAFWVKSATGESVYVMPANDKMKVQQGQTVSIEGRVLRSPEGLKSQSQKSGGKGAGPMYIYATSIKAA